MFQKSRLISLFPSSLSILCVNFPCFVQAAQYGIIEKCQQLIEEEGIDVRVPDAENVTILHWASINNRVQVMEYLISKGAVVDQRGGNLNGTPLHWAIR